MKDKIKADAAKFGISNIREHLSNMASVTKALVVIALGLGFYFLTNMLFSDIESQTSLIKATLMLLAVVLLVSFGMRIAFRFWLYRQSKRLEPIIKQLRKKIK